MKSKSANVIVIGADGNVGNTLQEELREKGHRVVGLATRRRVGVNGRLFEASAGQKFEFAQIAEMLQPVMQHADAGMIAIPNANRGLDELRYLHLFHDAKKITVTCAKAAHAYEYPHVLEFGLIGNSACVGGGSDILHSLWRRQLNNDDVIVYAILNGTINFIWSGVQAGNSFGSMLKAAKAMGYAEPGEGDPLSIINGELDDVAMKATIMYNLALSHGDFVIADEFKVEKFKNWGELRRLTSRNSRYRFMVTFSAVDSEDEIRPGTPGSLLAQCGRWRITAGFHNVFAETPWFDWLRELGGVNNGYVVYDENSEDTGHSHSGPGAGPVVTARAMVRDLNRLLAVR